MIALALATIPPTRPERACASRLTPAHRASALRSLRGAGSRRDLRRDLRNCGSRARWPSPTAREKTALRARSPSFVGENARQKILYEEMHPYGSSAYRSSDATSEVSARRYRYTGKERDEETGLDYFGARYYAPWLGRWTSADPLGLQAGLNLYLYGRASPVVMVDPNGMKDQEAPLIRRVQERLGEALHGASGGSQPELGESVSRARARLRAGEEPKAKGAGVIAGDISVSSLPGDVRENPSALKAFERRVQQAREATYQEQLRIDSASGAGPGMIGAPKDTRFTELMLELAATAGIARLFRGATAVEAPTGLLRSAGGKLAPGRTGPLGLLSARGASATGLANPVLADTNLLVQAQTGNQAALSALQANRVQITARVHEEFVLKVATHEQRVERLAFLEKHGITTLSSKEAAALRATEEFSSVSRAAQKAGHSLTDAELAAFGRASGREVLTGERRLSKFFNLSQPQHGVRIRRIQ